MEKELLSAEKKEIILEDGRPFSYIITQVEIANSLGAAVAVLDEYIITDSSGNTYKLYKANEGNWYDIPEVNERIVGARGDKIDATEEQHRPNTASSTVFRTIADMPVTSRLHSMAGSGVDPITPTNRMRRISGSRKNPSG